MFSKAELELVASLCQQHDVICISDEVYQWLVYDGHQHVSIGEPCRPGGLQSPGHLWQGPEPRLGVRAGPVIRARGSGATQVVWPGAVTSLRAGGHKGTASRGGHEQELR